MSLPRAARTLVAFVAVTSHVVIAVLRASRRPRRPSAASALPADFLCPLKKKTGRRARAARAAAEHLELKKIRVMPYHDDPSP